MSFTHTATSYEAINLSQDILQVHMDLTDATVNYTCCFLWLRVVKRKKMYQEDFSNHFNVTLITFLALMIPRLFVDCFNLCTLLCDVCELSILLFHVYHCVSIGIIIYFVII
jgi:hypothetical protein